MIDAQNLISVHWCQIESQSFGWSTKEQLYWFYRQRGTQLAHCALQKLCFNLEEFGEELHRNGSRVGLLLMTRMYAGPAFLNLASSGLLLNFCGIYNLSSLGLLIISWWLNWGIASSSSYHLPFVERVSCLVSWLTVIFYQDLCLNTCQFRSVPTLCDPMNRSMPGLPVHHQLPEFTQTHVHWVDDATQPSHPLSSPSPPALNLSQHQGLFQWVSSLHWVAKVLEFQLQHQSFQWTPRTDNYLYFPAKKIHIYSGSSPTSLKQFLWVIWEVVSRAIVLSKIPE